MSITVCLSARMLRHLEHGGLFWVYLNWALGLRALGCHVVWLEEIVPDRPTHEVQTSVATLKSHLERYGLECVSLFPLNGAQLPPSVAEGCLDFEEAAAEADLLLNMGYGVPELVKRFRRSAFLDIDPGMLQIWMTEGSISIPPHDVYFTIGETVGQPGARIPDGGLRWQHIPPCIALEWWPPHPAAEEASFTTVSQWSTNKWIEDADGLYKNDKRSSFMPFLDLPRYVGQPLELTLSLAADEEDERSMLQERGWRVRHTHGVASTPWGYQRYVQDSLGEFSCAKPAYVRLETAWISDRTLCYLASGKPAVVQYTGSSHFLPDFGGLFRFRNVEEAACYLELAIADYELQCSLARALAEEHFDAQRVVGRVLEQTLA